MKHLAGGATIYGMVVVASRLGWFILLPVYWKFLTPTDFGVIGIVILTQGFLVPVLGLGLHDAVQRYYPEWSEEQRRERLGTIWFGIVAWSLAVCLSLTIAHRVFNLVFEKVDSVPFFLVGLWTAFFMTLVALPLSVLRIRGEVKQFSYITAGVFLTQSAASVMMVAGFSMGAAGYLLGGLIGAACWAVGLSAHYWRGAVAAWRARNLRELLSYSLPMVPATILDGTISLFDRYFLDKHVPLATIGLYNVANQFGSAVVVVNQGLKSAWIPFLYRVMHDRKDAPAIVGLFSFYYVALLLPPALLVALLSREIIAVFDERYLESYAFVPWIVLTVYLQAVTTAMGRGLDLSKKNALWPVISAVQVAASLVALSYFVPAHGAIGAAWAIAIAAGVRALVQIAVAHRAYPRPFYGRRLLILWSMGLLTFWVGSRAGFDSVALSAIAKMAVVVAGTIATAAMVLDRGSMDDLRSFIGSKVSKARGRTNE
ncbi:lipopolysaccharide biosynthesis protein [Azospira restricta]|uniref:Lipopolysaccharide biosynthesis protein n=1 Tax=Azospira restricta TaxID=404405 RepID=A0A974SPK0_9RHOO|nr:lipopolysaccharide biosynthesis protein [Azospira restricta]QRJ64059.1 lipopolysaccharide biosynthesis protein [Azospira restricta]